MAVKQELVSDIPDRSDLPFWLCLWVISATYIVLIVLMLAADATFTTTHHIWSTLTSREIQYSINLSLISCTITTLLSLWAAVPIGYVLSRQNFWGKNFIDAVLDIPIVLPPLVIGISLLILFRWPPFQWFENNVMQVTFAIPAVILAQFMVACAFAVRTMRATFQSIDPRREQVALTLGCSRSQAFWMVALPEAWRGILTAATLAWARSLGEFGPILVFAGSTRMRTEVLPTTVFLELGVGNIEAAVAVSMIMVVAAMLVLLIVRLFGMDTSRMKVV